MGEFNGLKDRDYFIYAEHCPGLFGFAYMGWWLYAAPVIDGKPDKEQYHWLHCDWELDAVMTGLGLPRLPSYTGGGHGEYTEAFRKKYPSGLFCKIEGFGYNCRVTVSH